MPRGGIAICFDVKYANFGLLRYEIRPYRSMSAKSASTWVYNVFVINKALQGHMHPFLYWAKHKVSRHPKRQGTVGLPHNLNTGDEFIILITYPLTESLSGTEQRFVLRGSIETGVVMTAEHENGLPQKGETIKESING